MRCLLLSFDVFFSISLHSVGIGLVLIPQIFGAVVVLICGILVIFLGLDFFDGEVLLEGLISHRSTINYRYIITANRIQ